MVLLSYCACKHVYECQCYHCVQIPNRRGPVLGSGEFGVVHKGMWSTPEGTVAVALKVSHRDAPEPEKVKLLQEAAIMKQFVHPNVVRLLGAVTVEEPVC